MCSLALVSLGSLSPHLAYIFKHHVHMSVEGLHSAEYLAVVAAVDEHLAVSLDCLGKQGEGALVKSVLLRCVLHFVRHYISKLFIY